MISRFIFCAVVGGVSLNSTYPVASKPLTAAQMQAKAKYKSVSNLCAKKKKTKTVKDICERWEQHHA